MKLPACDTSRRAGNFLLYTEMGERKIRVGELVKRELSRIIHERWRTESVRITLTEADVSPDLKRAKIYYSVLGGREDAAKAAKFLMSKRGELRSMLGKNVVLKYTPEIEFAYDPSIERGMKILSVIDELDELDREGSHDNLHDSQ